MKNKNTPVKNTDTYTHKSQFCLYGSGLSYVLTTVHHKSKVSSVSFGGKRGKIKNFSAKSAWEEPGRFWGKAGKLPVAPTSDLIYLARQEYIQLRRLIRRWLKSLGYKLKFFNKIFRLHINMDGYWLQRLLRFVLGEPVELLYAYSFYSPP